MVSLPHRNLNIFPVFQNPKGKKDELIATPFRREKYECYINNRSNYSLLGVAESIIEN